MRLSASAITLRPGLSQPSAAAASGTAIRTGSRCTTLVKLPVAFSGGSRLNCAPEAGAIPSTRPVSSRPGKASKLRCTSVPGRSSAICVSLKFAST